MKLIIGIILLVILLGSAWNNYRGLKHATAQGANTTRYKIILGVDVILLVLILLTIVLQLMR